MGYITAYPTPVLNKVEHPFKAPLVKDEQGRLMEMEMIFFPGTSVTVIEKQKDVWCIHSEAYPSKDPIYVDPHFLKEGEPAPIAPLPSVETLLERLQSLVGTRYFWGGNWPEGISQMKEFYPEILNLPQQDFPDALCQGVDCSGLLYYVTEGRTPRNTSDLNRFGVEVTGDVKPLDLIVWRGHVLIVLSPELLIESRIDRGVVISPLQERMREVIELTQKAGKQLHIRRWHPEQL